METAVNQPYSERQAGLTALLPSYRVDLRNFSEKEYNKFVKLNTVRDWSQLSWMSVGRPCEVKTLSEDRRAWEREHGGATMDARTSWTYFNQAFHSWFAKDVPEEIHSRRTLSSKA